MGSNVRSLMVDDDNKQAMAERLRDLADRVDRGEIVGLVVVAAGADRSIMATRCNEDVQPYSLIGGLEVQATALKLELAEEGGFLR